MYGYVVPVKNELSNADFGLYRAFYCGICKSIGRQFGQMPRFTTNYDMVFFNLLLHEYTKQEVRFDNQGCIMSPRKKTVVCANELFDRTVAAGIILAYQKADDDVIDGGGLKKKAAKKLLYKHYRKAAAVFPEADVIVKSRYARLRELEKANTVGVDRVADCFASMLEEIGLLLARTNDANFGKLLYNVGKFVYIADAIDDIDEDFRRGQYNPFLCEYGDYRSRKQFLEAHRSELTFALASTVNRAIECSNRMVFSEANDLLRNILYKGLRGKCAELLDSEKKLPPPKI